MSKLQLIIEKAKDAYNKMTEPLYEFFEKHTNTLALLVARHPEYDKSGETLYIDFVRRGTSIRYRGKFYNTIVLQFDDPNNPPVNMYLKQIYDENERKENYDGDIRYGDIRNFRQLVNSLEIYFSHTELAEEYAAFREEVNRKQNFDELNKTIENDMVDDMDYAFREIFEEKFGKETVNTSKNDLCILLPEGLVLKIYNKYYNSIVLDSFGYSFAYLKYAGYSGVPEEEYADDEYTSRRDDVRNEKIRNHFTNEYLKVNELIINFDRGNHEEMIYALSMIQNIIEDETMSARLKTTQIIN